MASPQIEVLFVYDANTGAPITGNAGAMSFDTYKDDTGANVTQPTITEIGGGAYKFTPVFSNPARGIVYVLNTGSGTSPPRYSRYMRAEDWYTDGIPALQTDVTLIKNLTTGSWEVKTTGPEANRLLLYDTDGTTILYRFNLTDANGSPTTVEPYKRTKV